VNKIGTFLLGATILGFMAWALKDTYDDMFNMINTTVVMSDTASALWRFMPIIIPGILFVILVLFLTGHVGNKQENEG